MKTTFKTISLSEETYNALREQAEREDRTIGGQVKYLVKLGEIQNDGE